MYSGLGERRNDIDWLRIIAMLAVFVFHCTRFFDTQEWYVNNGEQSELLFWTVRLIIWPWVIELFSSCPASARGTRSARGRPGSICGNASSGFSFRSIR